MNAPVSRVEAVLFDLDGTLLDTPGAITHYLGDVVAAATGRAVVERDVRRLIGLPLTEMVARLTGWSPGPRIDDVVEAYRRRYREEIVPGAADLVLPGVVEGLRRLQAEQCRIAVVTSKTHDSAVAILEASGLAAFVGPVVGADDAADPKPAADPARVALDALRIGPEAAVVVGDSVHDVAMAAAVPMRSVGVTTGVDTGPALLSAGAEAVVDDLTAAVAAALHGPVVVGGS